MKCNFLITAFVLLVMGASSSGSQLNTMKLLSRDFEAFDENGRPDWGPLEQNYYTVIDEPDRSIWGTIKNTPILLNKPPPTTAVKSSTTTEKNEHFTVFDEEHRPFWGTIQTKPTPTTAVKSPTTTTGKNEHFTVYDEAHRPFWGPIGTTPTPCDKPTTTAVKSPATTTEKNQHFTVYDEAHRPVWGTIQTILPPLDKSTTTDKSPTTTTKKDEECCCCGCSQPKTSTQWDNSPPTTTDQSPTTTTEKNQTSTQWDKSPPTTADQSPTTTTEKNETPTQWDKSTPTTADQSPTTITEKNETPTPWDKPPTTISTLWDNRLPTISENFLPTTTEEDKEDPKSNGTAEENPCKTKLPPKKHNFSAPGRRKALEKCEEYKEEERYRLLGRKKQDDCEEYRATHREASPKIMRGRLAEQGDYPHMAAIGWKTISGNYDFMCGGVLISPNFVLTAAHCSKQGQNTNLNQENLTPKIVRLGDNNIRTPLRYTNRIDVKIRDIIKHKNHKSPSKYHDIALLRLATHVSFNADVLPACLWHQFDIEPLSRNGNVTGWGKSVSATSDVRSPRLLQAQLVIFDNKICNETLRLYYSERVLKYGIQDTQICAADPINRADTCQGDSGGPLQIVRKEGELTAYYVVGLTSHGIGCGALNIPGVYTRVSSYLDWIESCVWDDINSPKCKQNSKRIT